ncbi:MAG: aminotransferase class V-fold PLP-dependent enzyme [Saprospiraceae bacterium]|nr:aminotransferase class V-fold PLP-dependent enzyme [Saprospiraceae bacterium]
MHPRRTFFKKILGVGTTLSLTQFANQALAQDVDHSIQQLTQLDTDIAMEQEDLWKRIKQAYRSSPNLLDLNNGGVSPQAIRVQEAEVNYLHLANEAPSFYMWRVFNKTRERTRYRLALLGKCDPACLALTRNTTESINTILAGIDWKAGDEVILSTKDYSSALVAWRQISQRYGVKLRWITPTPPMEDNKLIEKLYLEQINKNTRFIHITQVTNWSGQIIPSKVIRKICDHARSKNIFTLVDGAHSFGLLDFGIEDLGCDAFATSLHKWICAPFGFGLLYLRKDKIADIWPYKPAINARKDDIRKFEHTGTFDIHREQAIGQAIDFHESIGTKLKGERLRFLKDYWCKKAQKEVKGFRLHTSLKASYSCGIALFSIEGIQSSKVIAFLTREKSIHCTGSRIDELDGIRISPHVFTTQQDLDFLIRSLVELTE